ncbi:hypothetical protein [Saccharibacillus alkalitolerans]|uniref:HNH endonuclease n=1 Tax=Saccharibacillus alkalitolerans TaxID=2705290 RepID=A0ABX0FA81_9BACL|nr:hypothetical protein [Saccharibacillus alkalitolerans]NGZ77330.1 hypothetical protein [Saccharibacillus alkalitolerans]
MMPVELTWMLGAAVLACALTAVLVIRSRRNRRAASNIVDLTAARRRKLKLQEAAGSTAGPETLKFKRKAASPAGAEIRRFVPKAGEGLLQSCSHCRKKSDSVGFFADEYGNLVGICKECRKSAKNRDLMPL